MVDDLRTENEHLVEVQRVLEGNRDDLFDRFDLGPLPSLMLDDKSTIRFANQSAIELLIPARGGLIGRMLSQFVAVEDRSALASHLKTCLGTDFRETCEVRLSLGTPIPHLVGLWSRRLFRHFPAVQVTIVDLESREGERLKNELLLEAVQIAKKASDAKDQFIGMLSHELRTPLTPVLMAASALQRQAELPPHLRDVFSMIVRNIQTEARLVDDLLDVTRIAQGKLFTQRIASDLHQLVRATVESSGAAMLDKKQSVWIELKAERVAVQVDPVRINQLFGNLLANAIKFSPTGSEIRVRSWNGASAIMVEVEDDGIGIAPENLTRVFEPFNQFDVDPARTTSGLGLGLTICRGIAEVHGGRIDVQSRGQGQGARFVVQLPLDTEAQDIDVTSDQRRIRPDKAEALPTLEKCCILLVEDHLDTAELMTELLNDEGYEVKRVGTVREALSVDLDPIDVIVSDLGLPDGSGLELIRKLQGEVGQHRPAIALSGFGTGLDVQASKEAGFDAHLTKPVDFARLIAAIRMLAPHGGASPVA